MVWATNPTVESRINEHLINVGTFDSDGTGDSIRAAFIKINNALQGLEDWNVDLEREIDNLNLDLSGQTAAILQNSAGTGLYYDPNTNTLNASQDIAETAAVVFHSVTANEIDVDNLTVDTMAFNAADVGTLTAIEGIFDTLQVNGAANFDGPVTFNGPVDIDCGNIDCGTY